MVKKTIGLNPLEEYLSAPKSSSKLSGNVDEKTQKAQQNNEPEHQKDAPENVEYEVKSLDFAEAVEVDMQGQLAIKGTRVPEEKLVRASKQRITLHISTELVDRVKNAVYWEPGLTVAGFAEEAFALAIENLEKERGAAFPQRKQHRLRGGRPVN
jgi:hypothetical protein